MNKRIAVMVVALVAYPALSLAADGDNAGGGATQGATVKGSKSNTSDRSSGNTGGSDTQATTVKGSKSNSSERSGNSAGGSAADGNTIKGSKSNGDN